MSAEFSWLSSYARNEYSQFGEDGIIDAIFDRIGRSNHWCFECGASDGIFFSNTRRLVKEGWDAILVEKDVDAYDRLVANSRAFARVRTSCEMLASIDASLRRVSAPQDIDLAVIDVDGQDYHLFNSMLWARPRVVMIEFDPNADPVFIPDIGGHGQAGVEATSRLAIGRFYTPVAQTWCNIILVAQPFDRQLYGHSNGH